MPNVCQIVEIAKFIVIFDDDIAHSNVFFSKYFSFVKD